VTLAEIEKRAIYAAIKSARGNKVRAAKALAIGKTTLYRKLKQYEQALKRKKKKKARR
jgi:DNA-binding NtrC family response regulator